MKSKEKILKIISLVLAVAIVFVSVFGVQKITAGEKIDVQAETGNYNSATPDFSNLFEGITKEELSTELDDLDVKLAAFIGTVDIDSLLYTDSVATLITKFIAELTSETINSVCSSKLKKSFPDAYEYVEALKADGKAIKDIKTIPFGIEEGNKKEFIKACGASAAHLGDTLLEVILCAPTAYNNALVPALESTHTGEMPSIFGFVLRTGLSPSARIEFLVEKIIEIIEPIKEAPLTYLCTMLPDFIINYNKACDFLNSNEKVAEQTGLSLPTIDSIISELLSALDMTAPEIDYDYLSKMGTASVADSGYTGGKRVQIDGDREVIFAYLADFILNLLTYENNFKIVEELLTKVIKSEAVQSSGFADLLDSSEFKTMLAALMDILAKLKPREAYDAKAETEKYNAQEKDLNSIFKWPATEANVTTVLNTVEAKVVEALSTHDIESIIFTDEIATIVAKVTAHLCDKELTDITFLELRKSFPDAYDYIAILQAQDKTWNDVDVIPFGITAGDKAMFIKACGAGAEHFGDALALSLMVNPHAYDDALLPLLESLHTGAMPPLEEFVAGQGLDGAYRMEELTAKVLTILEPIKKAPLSYLCEIVPDFIISYSKAAKVLKNNKVQILLLPDVGALVNDFLASYDIVLPEYNFGIFTDMATAETVESGNYTGYRMELKGDREVVFMGLATYLVQVLRHGNNMEIISNLLSDLLGIDRSILTAITSLIA